ncbi:HlyD family secretion protein [Geothrix alkalitolerans]|uniref:HlyD family secretion protein n=1 Tax=Geothrix alkalitolerans TaxID=2922724 RepID=UPI0023DEEBE4|nr:HlyD family secretion protein [Geothrix alkalitolerans]
MNQDATPVTDTPSGAAAAGISKAMRALLIGTPIALLLGGGLWLYSRNRVSTDDAQVDGHLVPVSCRVYGTVDKVLVEDNQAVKAGDPLVAVDPRDIQARLDQAKAALAQAKAQVEGARADLERAQVAFQQAKGSDLETAKANLDSKKASLDKAKMDVQRMKPLAEREEISAQQFDGIRTQAEVADGDWRAAQQKLASLQREADIRRVAVGAAEARLASAQAQVEQARASQEGLELQLGYTKILAPVDGVVTRKFVEAGQTIQPGQGLMTLIPLHQTWVTANFKETQLAKMKPGQEAEIKVDMNGAVLKGHVDSIAGSTGSRMSLLPPENAVGNFVKVVQRIPVKIHIDESEAQKVVLRPGMNVEATVIVK